MGDPQTGVSESEQAVAAASPPPPTGPKKPCRRCALPMPATANFCTECDSYQDWRRHLPGTTVIMSALTAVLAIIAGIVPATTWLANYGSHTELHVLGGGQRKDGEPVLFMAATNSGSSAAVIRNITLKAFPGFSGPVVYEIREPVSRLVGRQGTHLELGTDIVPAVAKYNLGQKLCDCNGTIEFEVEESGLFGTYTRTDTIEVSGRQLREWALPDILGEAANAKTCTSQQKPSC